MSRYLRDSAAAARLLIENAEAEGKQIVSLGIEDLRMLVDAATLSSPTEPMRDGHP